MSKGFFFLKKSLEHSLGQKINLMKYKKSISNVHTINGEKCTLPHSAQSSPRPHVCMRSLGEKAIRPVNRIQHQIYILIVEKRVLNCELRINLKGRLKCPSLK